jgi:hypothetical protein
MHRLPNFTLVRTPPVCVGASNVTGCWHVFLASATRGIIFFGVVVCPARAPPRKVKYVVPLVGPKSRFLSSFPFT